MMGNERRTIGVLVAVASLLFAAGSCAQRGDETVYLRFFNAYAGSGEMSIFGPSSRAASGLAFGERSQSFTPIDRNFGTSFEIVMTGASESFQTDLPLYEMYPQESATVLFKRRSDQASLADPRVYRHIRTGYNKSAGRCRLVLDNALSVKNGHLGQFNFFQKAKIKPACTGYVPRIGSYRESNKEFGRPGLITAVEKRPWFYFGRAEKGEIVDVKNRDECPMPSGPALSKANNENFATSDKQKRGRAVAGKRTLKFVWAGIDNLGSAKLDFQNESIVTYPPTRQYMKCIGWDPRESKKENLENLRQQQGNQIAQCRRVEVNEVPSFGPESTGGGGGSQNFFAFPAGIGAGLGGNTCGFKYQLESDFFSIHNPPSGAIKGTIQYAPSQYYFWVLYGRPVNPKVTQWGVRTNPSGGGGFKKPGPYP
ncbi:MAG: hypothetical protein ABEL76_04205 [Bradymonadaceae bacterium]